MTKLLIGNPADRKRKTFQVICIMKLSLILMLFSLHVYANGFSQKVSLNITNEKLGNALKQIEKQTGYRFTYSNQVVPASKPVTVNVKNQDLKEVLSVLFADLSLDYREEEGRVIVIFQKEEGKTLSNGLSGFVIPPANFNTSGRVLNERGEPMIGVTVTVKGTKKATASDQNGYFNLNDVQEGSVLVFSAVNIESSVEIKANQAISTAFIIRVKSKISQLDDVQVIGYGTTTKRKSTGSVSSITATELAKQPVGNPLAALSGRMSGMLIAQNNGVPGSSVQIQIRGQNSLSQGGIPLYVIDGVPFTNFNGGSPATDNLNAFGTSGASGGISPFSMINPSDIERIDVLKDADATSIYGSRGANGVILITTKKGSAGKTKLDVVLNTGTTQVNHFIPVLNLQQYLTLRTEAFKNDGVTPTATNAPDLLIWDTTKATDWQKTFIGGTGHIVDAQATLSGGDANTRFLFNAGYRRESTVFPGDNADKRFSTRLNIDHNSRDRKFNATFNASYSNDNTNLLTSDLSSVYNLPPDLPLYDAAGNLFFASGFTNPLTNLLKRYKGITTNLIGNAILRYTILPGLNVKANFGYTTTDNNQNTTNPASSQNPANNPTSSAVFADNKAENYIIEPTVEYTSKLGDGKFTALAGASWQHNTSNGYFISGTNYSSEALLGTLAAAGTTTVSYNNIVEYKYTAFFGRVNYDWKGKYILNATFRRDGSSRFGPNNRFGNFGAIGASWIFSEEAFVKDHMPFLSFGKLRGSYGTTGNDQIGNYQYLSLYGTTTAYLGNAALLPGTLSNPNIQWETTNKLEGSLELGFLKDRILLTANYYRNRSGNQITFVSVPLQTGYNSIAQNLPALIQNSGLELELNTVNIKKKDFKWSSALNITLPKNKLVDFPGLANTFSASSYIIGEPINFTRLYQYTGIDPATGKATYADLDKDGVITTNDRYVASAGIPYYGGLNNSFTYKNFQLDVFFQFNHRMGKTNLTSGTPGSLSNQNVSVLDRWKQAGDITAYPGATTTAGSPITTSYSQFTSSDAQWGDASYLKLRSINLSYTLPEKLIAKISMSSCRIFVQGQNLFTWAKNKYTLDTETTVQGGPSGLGTGVIGQVLPPLRTIVFGINCSF